MKIGSITQEGQCKCTTMALGIIPVRFRLRLKSLDPLRHLINIHLCRENECESENIKDYSFIILNVLSLSLRSSTYKLIR